MRVNVTPRWTHTHRDLGIRIIYRRIIRRNACVRVWGRKVLVGMWDRFMPLGVFFSVVVVNTISSPLF